MNSHIFYDNKNLGWKLQSLRNPERYLLLDQPNPNILPLGRHTWRVGFDLAVCKKSADETLELTFSVCNPNMFTCNSGDCVPLRLT